MLFNLVEALIVLRDFSSGAITKEGSFKIKRINVLEVKPSIGQAFSCNKNVHYPNVHLQVHFLLSVRCFRDIKCDAHLARNQIHEIKFTIKIVILSG